jgi:hypothetical protein
MTLMNTEGRATSASDTRIVTVTGHVRRILATATSDLEALEEELESWSSAFNEMLTG